MLDAPKKQLDSTNRRQKAGVRSQSLVCRPHQYIENKRTVRGVQIRSPTWFVALWPFDSINRNCIWNALISPKFIRLIKTQWDGIKCRVQYSGRLSVEFNTISGVRQGFLMPPILFLIVLDGVLTRVIDEKPSGITGNLQSHVYMYIRHADIQNKIDNLITESNSIGLKINSARTKTLKKMQSTLMQTLKLVKMLWII